MSTDTTISVVELAAISIDNRITRIADALEKNAEQGERIANALDLLAGLVACMTEVVESDEKGGESRCTLRGYSATPNELHVRDSD